MAHLLAVVCVGAWQAGSADVVGEEVIPYEAPMIVACLRSMSDADLAAVQAHQFQKHPAPVIVKGAIIREMIANERQRRLR